MRISLLFFFLLCSVYALSQNFIYIGSKGYPSTKSLAFLKSGKYFGYEQDARLYVCFAKGPNGGYVMLSTSATSDESISGTVFIYMKDGNVITLNSRVSKDFVDDEAVVIYSLNTNQINSLKSVDISKIRYTIVSPYEKKGFTADNKNLVSVNPNSYEVHETTKEITELFEN